MNPSKEFVHGDRPSHFHILANGDRIECNSPYCGELLDTDPRQLTPIIQGREPWRGRN